MLISLECRARVDIKAWDVGIKQFLAKEIKDERPLFVRLKAVN
jgi:hypothetical protein